MQIHYLHAAKCGGTSLQHHIRTNIQEKEYFYGESVRAEHPLGISELWRAKFIHDHIGKEFSTPWPRVGLFTFRDPFERCYSAIEMVRRWGYDAPKNEEEAALYQLVNGPLSEVANGRSEIVDLISNGMFRCLIGDRHAQDYVRHSGGRSWIHALPEALINQAIQAIKSTAFVLPVNRIADCAMLIQAFGRSDQNAHLAFSLNQFGTKKSLTALSPDDKAAIRSLNNIDCILMPYLEAQATAYVSNIETYRDVLSETRHYDFAGPVPLSNTWPREVNGNKNAIWTAEGGSHVQLGLRGAHTAFVIFHVTSWLSETQLGDAELTLNGTAAESQIYTQSDGSRLLIATLYADQLYRSDGRQDLHIQVPVMRPPDPNDPRQLGLEISGMTVISCRS